LPTEAGEVVFSVQTGCGTNPGPSSVDTGRGDFCPWVKRLGPEADHAYVSSCGVKNE